MSHIDGDIQLSNAENFIRNAKWKFKQPSQFQEWEDCKEGMKTTCTAVGKKVILPSQFSVQENCNLKVLYIVKSFLDPKQSKIWFWGQW